MASDEQMVERILPELAALKRTLQSLPDVKTAPRSTTGSSDMTALAEEVVRVLNTPGGPTLAKRAVADR